jgi:hypothetical protein
MSGKNGTSSVAIHRGGEWPKIAYLPASDIEGIIGIAS